MAERTAARAVLLLTRRGDGEATETAALLHRIGVPVHRIDADGLAQVRAVRGPDGVLDLDGHRFTPTVTWLRHFSARAAAPAGTPGGELVYRDAWTALARQLAAASPAAIGADDPGLLVQRDRARALGVRVPRALVTTDPARAAELLPARRYVLKVLDRHYVEPEPGRLDWFLPRVLDRDRLGGPEAARLPHGTPVLLQEYVGHDTEYRVYCAGDEVHAFEVAKERPEDIWDRPDEVVVRRVRAPEAVVAAARALAGEDGAGYGAYDFLWAGGEPVFLEMNAHGDWHWFERKAGTDAVTRAVVRTVRDLHRSAAGGARPEPVSLLAFLGAGRAG
ncbi:hypothetical protein [Streptomyces sp. NPDC088864]|uniref:hypothetical protein n=1 Tax=Streptomyces sp. NPDC088864 TaxID=3365910 RepID=UPI00380D7A63